MSHAGPPPPDEPTYNPYPDNWESASASNPRFEATAPPPDPSVPQSYGAPPTNPYGGNPSRPTFTFGGFAGWLTRVGAYLIDWVLTAVASAPLYVGEAVLAANTSTTTNPDGTTSAHYSGSLALPIVLLVIGAVTSLAFTIWNFYIRQGRTGATVGKSVLAIRLVNADFQPIGPGWAFLRQLLHIVDALPCGLGYLNPIWDSKKQTFADKIMNTYVIHAASEVPRPF